MPFPCFSILVFSFLFTLLFPPPPSFSILKRLFSAFQVLSLLFPSLFPTFLSHSHCLQCFDFPLTDFSGIFFLLPSMKRFLFITLLIPFLIFPCFPCFSFSSLFSILVTLPVYFHSFTGLFLPPPFSLFSLLRKEGTSFFFVLFSLYNSNSILPNL